MNQDRTIYFLRWIIMAGFFLLASCLKIEEIDFISFQADFQAPSLVRVGQRVDFLAGSSTAGASAFEWRFGDPLASESSIENPKFVYDSIGTYDVSLKVQIQRTNGVLTDSTQKSIQVIPPTENLPNTLTFGSSESDEVTADIICLPSQSGYIVLAKQDVQTLYLQKLDINFNTLWVREFSNISDDPVFPQDIQLLADGGFLLSGIIQASPSNRDAFLMRLDSEGQFGTQGWLQLLNSLKDETYLNCFEITDGITSNFMAVGNVIQNDRSTLLIDRYDAQGTRISTQNFQEDCRNCKAGKGLLLSENNSSRILLAGTDLVNPSVFSFSVDLQNVNLDFKNIISTIEGEAQNISRLKNGQVILTGLTRTTQQDSNNLFVAKLEQVVPNSVPAWTKILSLYQEVGLDISETDAGNILVLGQHYNPQTQDDLILAVLNPFSGALLQVELYGDANPDKAALLFQDADGNHYIAGSRVNNFLLDIRDISISPLGF